MTKCLVCKTSIDKPLEQFGKPERPICGECFLSGKEGVYASDVIVRELENGANLEEAQLVEVKENNADLEKFSVDLWNFLTVINRKAEYHEAIEANDEI